MKRFSSTAYSSADLEALWRKLPPEAARMTLEIADIAQRHLDSPGHAREIRTQQIEAAIEKCYRDHQRYFETLLPREQTRKMREKLENMYGHYDLAAPPSLSTIRRTLKQIVK